MLVEFSPQGQHTIAISADERVIRSVAGSMAVDYRARQAIRGGPMHEIEATRIRVLDAIAKADFDDEDESDAQGHEGRGVEEPAWWDSLATAGKEDQSAQ